MPRALILRHHDEDRPGLVGDALESRGFEITVALLDAQSPTPTLENVDLLVILGSKHAVYDADVEAAWFGRELALIADADQRGVAIFGICFGAQAIKHFGIMIEDIVYVQLGKMLRFFSGLLITKGIIYR